ncbi:hypothetical protein HYS03_02805 [Candidatus Woesebacteria bacterium]|nr:hypothetical protein [Candidatus Woesebacteria bacterium]QQG47232.1 MAG: hypothetical protein HY044_03845 [Candidatus Woesebacteria bacterium]
MNITLPSNIQLSSSNIPIIVIGAGVFLLFVILAQMSRGFISWSLSGAGVGFFGGIIATVAILALVIYFGRGAIKAVLTWDKAPAPIKNISSVLGAKTEKVTNETVKIDYNSLPSEEKDNVKSYICPSK